MEDAAPEQLNRIQKQLTEKYKHKQFVKKYVEDLWKRIIASKKLDIVPVEKLSRMVDAILYSMVL